MNIGIIGTGNVGATLGRIFARQGHSVMFSYSRDPQKLADAAQAAGNGAQSGTPRQAVAFAEVVLLAVPWSALDDALAQMGAPETLGGEIVWSSVNALKPDMSGLAIGTTTSAAETIAECLPGARVVEGLPANADVLQAIARGENPFGATAPSAFLCGDDAQAKLVVTDLMSAAGMDAQDAGPLSMARLLEPAGLLVGLLGYTQKRALSVRVLR